MKFVCGGGGTIKRFTFLGWVNESSEQFNVIRLTSWPYFSLWHQHNGQLQDWYQIVIGPEYHDELIVNIISNQPQVVEIMLTFTTNVAFSQGDILGVGLQQCDPPISRNGIHMTVLERPGIYGQTLVCDININECNTSTGLLPYIAIETGETLITCTIL